MRVLQVTTLQDLVDFLPWFVAACSLVALAFVVFQSFPPTTARRVKKPKPNLKFHTHTPSGNTISDLELERAQKELNTLLIERDIVSYALTTLFEAEAQGKITDRERDRLISKYKEDMRQLEKNIEEKESIVNLHKLESMQTNLLEIFQKRFDEVSSRIEEVRSELKLEIEPTLETVTEKPREEVEEEKEEPDTTGSDTVSESPVEEKLKEIEEEVMKEIEKLRQMEAEEGYDELDRQIEEEGSD
jgi:gas vesicle protein